MAWFRKEAPDTSYLGNEKTFVQSASYEARKAFIKDNSDRFWKWNYSGSTAQNEKFRNKLLAEPDLLEKYEASRTGIIRETRNQLGTLKEQNNRSYVNKQRRSLFGNTRDDETIILSRGWKAEYWINTTLCAKTARENAKNLFGVNIPRSGNARDVIRQMDRSYPQISLSNERNISNMAEVAYVSLDVVWPDGKKISHVALATKPRWSTNWFITDPYQSWSSWIRISEYPATLQKAWKLNPQYDNLTLGKNKEALKVRTYKAADGAAEYETSSAKIEYGKIITWDNVLLALGDRNVSWTMGDDTRRKRFLGIIPYGREQDTSISSEQSIALELQNIADLPHTNVNQFIAQCIRVWGGWNYNFQNRQDVINAFFGNEYNKELHQKFIKWFTLLHLSWYIRDVKSNDSLWNTRISAIESNRPGYARMIESELDQVDSNNPLYAYIQQNKKQLSRTLSAQFGAFLDANSGALKASGGVWVDLHKNIKIVAGIANGQPGVWIMLHNEKKFSWGQLNGSIGAWNVVPFAAAGISLNNAQEVKKDLTDYTRSVKSIGVRGMITPLGGGGEVYFERDKLKGIEEKVRYLEEVIQNNRYDELPAEIRDQFYAVYNEFNRRNPDRAGTDFNKAMRAVVQMYKAKLAEKNEGLYLSWAGVGMAYIAGLPAILAHIKASYLSNNYVPDKSALSDIYTNFITGRGVNWINTRAAWTGAINEQFRESLYWERPFVAQWLIMGWRNTLRLSPKQWPTLNVLAAPWFRENIRYERDGTIYVQQMPGYPLPTITLRTVKVGTGVRHYLIVGRQDASGSSRIQPGENGDSRVYNDGSRIVPKTIQFPFYHGIDTVPNNANPRQIDINIGVTLRQKPKDVRPERPNNPEKPIPEKPITPHPKPNPEEPNNPKPNPEEPWNTPTPGVGSNPHEGEPVDNNGESPGVANGGGPGNIHWENPAEVPDSTAPEDNSINPWNPDAQADAQIDAPSGDVKASDWTSF